MPVVGEEECRRILLQYSDGFGSWKNWVVLVQMTMDLKHHFTTYGPSWNGKLEDVEAVILNFSIYANSAELTKIRFEERFENSDIQDLLVKRNERFYLKSVPEFLEDIPWIRPMLRAAASGVFSEKRMPVLVGADDRRETEDFYFRIIFHRDYLTLPERISRASFFVSSTGNKGIGTAFGIRHKDRKAILSAKHIAAVGETVILTNPQTGKSHRARIAKSAPFRDASLLELESGQLSDSETLVLGNSSLVEVGDRVLICGYPAKLGTHPTVSEGHISKTNATYKELTEAFQISSAAINPNNSGGPVIDESGEIIGILTDRALKADIQNICFAETINNVVDELGLRA